MIRFDSVSKRYRGASRAALDGVTLGIDAGEFVFLVGASGSGKSSLLRLMLREEKPSTGEIHVLGQRLTTISTRKVPYFRRSLGVVFQDFRLLPNKTVHDNVAFTLQVLGKSRGFIQTTVPDVLDTVGLADKAQNFPHELSGGEQQRVAIARAVVNKPAILLADEPTGNLDPRTSEGIMQVLERINTQGTTVVMATHDVTIVDRMQKRVVELVQGRIIRDEREATYVTSSIKLPKRDPEKVSLRTGSVATWAPPAKAARPASSRPPTAEVPVIRPPEAPAASVATAPEAPPEPLRPVTGVRPTAPAAAPVPVPPTTPAEPAEIWVRGDTGPVLVPGEHAPWRAAPVAPPQAPEGDSRSLFFAAPVPAQHTPSTGEVPVVDDAASRTAEVPVGRRRSSAWGPRPVPSRIDLDDTGDQGDDEAVARHRGPASDAARAPLPDHLDFLTGLGLRDRRRDDEVGPSS